MDGESNGPKTYEQIDDLGGFTTPIFGLTRHVLCTPGSKLQLLKSQQHCLSWSRGEGRTV